MILTAVTIWLAAAPAERPKLLVIDLVAQGVSSEQAAAFTDAVVSSLAARRLFRVVSSKDVQTVLSVERQRQLIGSCNEPGGLCGSNLSEALGTRFVISGSVSQLGSTFQLQLQMIDTVNGTPLGRSSRLADDLQTLRQLVPYAAAEASGSPLPPPPSRILQYSMIATGAGLFVAGSFVGMLALSRQQVLNDEISGDNLSRLQGRDYYQRQDQSLGKQKTLALGLMAAGVTAAAVGFLLMPPATSGMTAAVIPSSQGMALVGSWP